MNKELYNKNIKLLEEITTLYYTVNDLQKFLEDNEKNFEREKSINALKKIKTFLELKQKEYQECEVRQKRLLKI